MTEIIQILEKFGLFAFNLISITIFMIPVLFLTNINSTETVKDILDALKKMNKRMLMKKYVDTFRYGKEVYEM